MESRGGDADETMPEDPVEELRQELADEKERAEELLTRLKYAQADLENYRKRMDKEFQEAAESPVKSLVTKLLVVQDELELALKHTTAGEGNRELTEGIRMVHGNLGSALRSAGVERVEALGRPFDPSIHEAVEKVQGGASGADIVVEEVRPGFTFRGQVLRPSMVKVELARKAPKEAKAIE